MKKTKQWQQMKSLKIFYSDKKKNMKLKMSENS